MVGTMKESINALINLPIINHPEMSKDCTSPPRSSSASKDTDLKVPATPVKNFGNRQKIQRRRNDSEDERHYASDDERSSDDTLEQYHPQVSAKKVNPRKRRRSLSLATRKHCIRISSTKSTKKRKLRIRRKKPSKKTKVVKQEQDPLFPRPKLKQCEFCEKGYLTNFKLKKHMAKHLAVRKWSITRGVSEDYLLRRRVDLDNKRPKIWGMVFSRSSGVM